MTLNHLHLRASSVRSTREFYERFFDFELASEHGELVFLRDGAGFLIAVDPSDVRVELPEWFHIGFCQKSEADVFAMYARLREGGATVVRDMLAEPGEYASFYVTDPDGIRIEVSWHADE